MNEIKLDKLKHVHMVGVGGIGMSALAQILIDMGITVSGSDLKSNRLTEKLKEKGCTIFTGHSRLHGTPDLVVRSFGIKDTNPEIAEAKKSGIKVIDRSELLKAVIDSKKRSVSICGAHGKTTTTSMVSYLMDKAGLDPTVLIGGVVEHFDGNARTGKSDILVAETDESDGYISALRPRYIVITNIDNDHMDVYKNMKNLVETFRTFLRSSKPDGVLFYNIHDENLKELSGVYPGKKISFGFSHDCSIYADSIMINGMSAAFTCFYHGDEMGKVTLNVPGRHNILNALAAIACLLEFGVPFEKITAIIREFKSAKRRFEIRHDFNGIMVVEDYAHHPTEIKTVIDIAQVMNKGRIIVVFQPHRFSRTIMLEDEFSRAFSGAHKLILTDIYAANETRPVNGGSLNNMYNKIRRNGFEDVRVMEKQSVAKHLGDIAKRGDIMLVMGAGDINEIIPEIISNISGKKENAVL